jgi:GntR family transcriptional regulator
MTEPIYRLIAEDLRAKIESGELEPGQQLSTELELREQYEASRNTVRDAIKWLTNRGLVETRPGQGTFVVQRINPSTIVLSSGPNTDGPKTGDAIELESYVSKIRDEGRQVEVTEPRVEIRRARGELALQLDMDEGLPVISRHQRLTIDGIPWVLQTTFYPMDFVNQGALRLIETENLDMGAVAYLKEEIGVTQSGWYDVVVARAPDATEASFFGLPDGGQVPVVEVQRTGIDEAGLPIRLAVSVFPADRNILIYREGRPPKSLTHYSPGITS